MEIVIGTVEVGGHYGYVVGTVLEIVTLTHLQAGYLGYSVLLVGVFQGASEQEILFHRLRGILRINASRTQKEQFLYTMSVGLANYIALDLHVHHYEVCAI